MAAKIATRRSVSANRTALETPTADSELRLKVLALSFLLLIGVSLVADGFGLHVPKGYIYFAMGFSVFVEMINLRVRKQTTPVKLHSPYVDEVPKP